MILETVLLVAACLVVPALWGWLVYRLFVGLGLHLRLPGPARDEKAPEPSADAWDYQI